LRIVLDTDVLIAAVVKPRSYSARVLRMVREGEVGLAVDERILREYRRILRHFRFRLSAEEAEALVKELGEKALRVTPTTRVRGLPDAGDVPFVEVALAAEVDALVTANLRHYPREGVGGVEVTTARDFIRGLRGG
jgi:putative PIN family toxin of toxin-antitoxin system